MAEQNKAQRPIVVQKYGGSSVADTQHLRRVAERIVATRKAGKDVVVVVSAMASTTDELLAKARQISASPSRRELDMLLSCGERASMALLAMAVHELGQEAVSLTGSQSGIMTNDRHSGARIIEVRPVRVADELSRDKIVIVAGFQGVSYKREITTLGRGGSDATAVALAGALGAEYCEICSDVDGVFTADPRIVAAAELLPAIRGDEMLALAAHGAKVLHAGCVELAAEADIKLYACATAKNGGGTRVDRIGGGPREKPVGIAGSKNMVRLRAAADAPLLAQAAAAAVPMTHYWLGAQGQQLWFALEDVPDWPTLREALDASVQVEELVGMVSIVGAGFGADAARVSLAIEAARRSGSEILGISTSPLRVSVFCLETEVDDLVRELHRELVEKG